MKRILCYGDSNTWGYIPGEKKGRYGNNERWTKLLQKKLGTEYEIIEEGLNSRTLMTEDTRPGKEGRNGFTYLKPCLDSHDKIDIFVLMLGTNELKTTFDNTPSQIITMFDRFIKYLKSYKSQIDGEKFRLIVLGIPPVKEMSEDKEMSNKYLDAEIKCTQVQALMKDYCVSHNLSYVDNSDLEVGIDGVHLTLSGHKILADRLYEILK